MTTTNAEMMAAGFTTPEEADPRVFCMTQGPEKCGKTDWALRHAPGPIAVLSLDTGTRDIAAKIIKETRKNIVIWSGEVPPPGLAQREYEASWKELLVAHRAIMKNLEVKTYVWDTATEVWELKRLAAFGKLTQVMPHHYGPVNTAFRDMVKDVYKRRPDLNFIAIHKQKKQYVDKKGDGKDCWNGKYERAGFGDFPYLADVCLLHYYDQGDFGVRVIDAAGVGARQTADVAGLELEGDECSFFWLACSLYPDTDPEYWWDGCSGHPLAD